MDKQVFSLGIEGFTYPDLFESLRLKELTEYFYKEVETACSFFAIMMFN